MLRRLDRATLHRLHKRATRAQLPAGGKLDIDLTAGGVLDVLLQVKLHDRIAAGRAQHIGRGQRHHVIGGLFAGALLLLGLGCGLG